MEKIFVAKRVAGTLHGAEAAIDAAMVETAAVMADMVQARKDLGLSATVGAAATAKVMAAMAALSEARTEMVGAHAELEQTGMRLGIRTKMIGWMKDTAQVQDEVRLSEAS